MKHLLAALAITVLLFTPRLVAGADPDPGTGGPPNPGHGLIVPPLPTIPPTPGG